MKVYVENGKPKMFVYDDSPYDWSKEPGLLVETPFTPETHSIGELVYDPSTKIVQEASP